MFSHVVLGSNDVERSRRFYDALFEAAGGEPGQMNERGGLLYVRDGVAFMVGRPRDGGPATHANGGTVGFTLPSPEAVDSWHRLAVEHGGMAVEDPPGRRETPFGPLYLAYLRDPDGNKLCALHHLGTGDAPPVSPPPA